MALTNLEGVRERTVQCEFFAECDEIEPILDSGIAATSAGDNGAINIWVDDDGFYRCESMKLQKTLDKKIFTDLDKVLEWAAHWLVKIH